MYDPRFKVVIILPVERAHSQGDARIWSYFYGWVFQPGPDLILVAHDQEEFQSPMPFTFLLGEWKHADRFILLEMDAFEKWRVGLTLLRKMPMGSIKAKVEADGDEMTITQRIRVLKSIQTRWLADLLAVRALKLDAGLEKMLEGIVKRLDSAIEELGNK